MREFRSGRHRRWLRRWRVAGIGAACLVSLALALAAIVIPGRGSAMSEEEKALQDLRGIVRTSDPLRISVLGDSTGNDPNEWVALWAEHLGETHRVIMHRWEGEQGAIQEARTLSYGTEGSPVVIWNMSEPGATASYPADKLDAGQPEEPDVVILSFGHNNDKTNVGSQLGQVRRSISKRWRYRPYRSSSCCRIQESTSMAQCSGKPSRPLPGGRKEDRVPTIDVASAFENAENQPSLMYDDIHPNAKGSRLWADVVEDALG